MVYPKPMRGKNTDFFDLKIKSVKYFSPSFVSISKEYYILVEQSKRIEIMKLILLMHVILLVMEVVFFLVKMSLWNWLIPTLFCIGVIIWLFFGKRWVALLVRG